MSSTPETYSLWYREVVQPKLQVLSDLACGQIQEDFPLKNFFKSFLADLELMGLDNYTVEGYVERILDGFEALKDKQLMESVTNLRQIALIAMLSNRFDRALFLSYWTQYRPLTKKSKNLKDESIVNAYKVSAHIQMLISYISRSATNEVPANNIPEAV